MEYVLESMNSALWGMLVLVLILIVGIYLSVKTRFAQVRYLPKAIREFLSSIRLSSTKEQGASGYRALCTALAATVGTGNIAGVAGAIAIGGPGVIFWMWGCAFLGMVTKFAEVTLAHHFRIKNLAGEDIGGPMYMITYGLPESMRPLAFCYAFFGVVASFGIGNATQVNAIAGSIKNLADLQGREFGMAESWIMGAILAILIAAVLRNGFRGIGYWTERLVPIASIGYILLSVGVLIVRWRQIPAAFAAILNGAFLPKAVTCGVIGSVFLTLRVGASRGVFTNEAGMGTASIAHATAQTDHCVKQGMMGIIEVFLDTIVICTLTALVILCSEVTIPFGTDPGIHLTMEAFSCVYGDWSRILLSILVCIFAFATILGWSLYGTRCCEYLLGDRVWRIYCAFQAIVAMLGCILNTSVIWLIAELLNGLMAIPNLIAIILLTPVLIRLLGDYRQKEKRITYGR